MPYLCDAILAESTFFLRSSTMLRRVCTALQVVLPQVPVISTVAAAGNAGSGAAGGVRCRGW